ncbi:MAG TPA: permease prefix domain 1-containing protein, partial [Bryobacteraceae bacterium]|nr:permease prefix domain 1-containing protein [Bryobacteraceae bacterium]
MKRDDEFREEIESHVAMRADLNRDAGLDREQACESARRQFGNRTVIQEEMRRMHVNTFVESLIQDLHYAV